MQKGRFRDKISSSDYLVFEEICPTWASKLRTSLDNKDVRTLVHDSKYCIVSEAWGYTGRQTGYYIAPLIPLVGCWTCVRFGKAMGKVANHSDQSSVATNLQPVISNFVEHWNDKHSGMLQRPRFRPS